MKRIVLIGIYSMLLLSASAQVRQAKEVFLAMPDSLCPMLTQVNRADFIDFMESKMKAEVGNQLDGRSQMTALTTTYLSIRLSECTEWQMKLLPTAEGDTVVCVVQSALQPVPDSHLKFYTMRWEELPADSHIFSRPRLTDFLTLSEPLLDAYGREEAALRKATPLLMKADLHPDSLTLSLRLTTTDYMEPAEAGKLKPHLREVLRYQWDGKGFAR